MSVRIRLKRMGRKNLPFYRIVAIDSRKRRDGEPIEEIGYYSPRRNANSEIVLSINIDKLKYWLGVGAQPSDVVKRLIEQNK